MKVIRLYHYILGVICSSLYCGAVIHFAWEIVPLMVLGSAYLLAFPLIAPFMAYQQSIYPTPQASDFPILLALYPLYFAILFSPLLLIALRNKNTEPGGST